IGDDWSWTCKQLSIGSDWFDFLLYGTVALRIKMDGLNIKTVLNDNGLCVRKHLGFSSGGKSAVVPIFLQSLTIDDCKMQVYEPYTKSLAKAHFFWNMKKIGNALKSTIRFLDGSFVVKKTPVFQNIQGPVRLDIFSNSTSSPLMIRSNCTVDFPHMGTKRSCYFSGSWRYEQGVFSLYNDDRSFVVAPIKLYMVGDTLFSELKSYFPASYLYKLFSGSTLEQELSGQCALTMNVEFEGAPSRVSCSLTSSNVSYKKKSLFSACKISCNRDNAQWHGKTFFSLDPANFFTGTFKWDEALSTGNITLKNQKKSAVPFFKYWNILPNNFSTTIEYDDKSTIKSFYNCVATHKKTEATCCSSGTIEWNNDGLFARGMIDKKKYDGSFLVDPHFCMKHCDFYDEKEKKLFSFNADKKRPEIFSGVVFFPCIKQVAKHFSGHSLQGQGAAKIDGKIQDKKLFMQMQLNDSAIRIPYTYNLINQLCARCNVDFENKIFTVQNVECTLHRGTVECKRLIFNFDENYNLCFAHVPIIFNDCLINWNKDLFAIISGHLTFTKNETSLIKGRFFVDRSQLKKNIFSSDFQQQFFSLPSYAVQDDKTPIELDITIKTKDPVRINTSFLQTSARLDLAFAGTIQKPKPSGKISVFSGDLAFPYKPLHITSGLIDFSSGKLDDPAVEIVAQNKLKKYNVKLAVSGSFQKQDIILESRPSLTQEQILS
ncbi:translocation/assembly module TamB domain-containing protein, partial [bacterium]|nr:translocation/assembly module TamB domain-containing protein [bacterium]